MQKHSELVWSQIQQQYCKDRNHIVCHDQCPRDRCKFGFARVTPHRLKQLLPTARNVLVAKLMCDKEMRYIPTTVRDVCVDPQRFDINMGSLSRTRTTS